MVASDEGVDPPSREPRAEASAPPMRALAKGLDQSAVMSMELMAGILTWMGIGWLADRWLGTMPWLMVVGALIGNAAGIYLIWVRSARADAHEARVKTATGVPGEIDERGDGRAQD